MSPTAVAKHFKICLIVFSKSGKKCIVPILYIIKSPWLRQLLNPSFHIIIKFWISKVKQHWASSVLWVTIWLGCSKSSIGTLLNFFNLSPFSDPHQRYFNGTRIRFRIRLRGRCGWRSYEGSNQKWFLSFFGFGQKFRTWCSN